MCKNLTLELDDIMYENLIHTAHAEGRELREWAMECLMRQLHNGAQS